MPCVLQTKKRYVGYAYESEDQNEPIFDAKGIEIVRRDGCPAVVKVHHAHIFLIYHNTLSLFFVVCHNVTHIHVHTFSRT